MSDERFLKVSDVIAMTSLSRSTIYERVQDGKFPKQIKLSIRRTVWRLSDVSQWMDQQVADVG
jgi:prophage regulatory protein